MEASLCYKSKFVAFIAKKFQIENYMPIILMTSHNEHSVSREQVYLEAPFRGTFKFLCSVFAETEVIDKQISFLQHDRSVTCPDS